MPKQWKTIASSMLKDSGYPVYGANGIIGYYSEYNHDKETILVTCRGATCGSVNICEPFSYINGNAMALDNLDGKIDIKYLYYYLKKRGFDDVISGSAQPQITRTSIEKIEIPICEISKQKMIVNLFDKIELLINNQKRQLQLLDELVKARFVEMFGDPMINPYEWKVINISEVLRAKASNGFFSRRDDYCDDGNVEVLGVANVVNRMYSQVVDLPRTNANEKDIEKFEVKYGDMLFCRSSLVAEGIGKASIIPEGVQTNILFECHVIRLPLDLDKCVPEFLQTLSTTKFFRNQIISKSKTATMTTIGQDGILKTNIILPPLEKQKEYYNFVKQIDKSRSRIQKSLEASQELFDSLMQEYFG